MANEPETSDTPHGKDLKKITGPLKDKWDVDMLAAKAWQDPTLPLANRVAERRKELENERQVAIDTLRDAKTKMIESQVLIDRITGAVAIIDELMIAMLQNAPDYRNDVANKK